MKKILSILAFALVAIAANAQVYSNVPAGPIMPVATPFSAYWVNTATDAASGLSLLGGGTNSGGGTTNFLLSGVVTGQTTNNSFSSSGSNVIANIAQQYAGGSNSINNLNGFGTNTTLKSAISISTTNLSAKGTAWLNNSNVVIYLYGYAGNSNGVIPYMTSSNTPSGLATANTNTVGRDAYLAFQPINQGGASSWAVSSTFGITSNWLQYKFDAPVTVYSNVFGLNFNGGSFFLQSSMDGLSWNLITNQTLPAFPSGNGVTNSFSPVTAIYFRWLFTNMTAPPSIAINDNKLFGTSSQGNVFSNSYTLSILATNGGVAINTNSAGTNALEVFGNIDSTVGFSINGQPIGGAASSPIGTYSQLYVTNATGSATNYNGIYTSAGSYYTNNTTGWFIVAPATWYPSATNIPRSSYTSYGLITNLVGGTTIPAFSNATLIGTYSGNPTNIFPTVTPYYGQTSGTTYTNFSGTIGAGGILGNGIDTNLSPAQLASAGVVTNNQSWSILNGVQVGFTNNSQPVSVLYMYGNNVNGNSTSYGKLIPTIGTDTNGNIFFGQGNGWWQYGAAYSNNATWANKPSKNNITIGNSAGQDIGADNNIMIGGQTGWQIQYGGNNIIVGEQAMSQLDQHASNNVVIGAYSAWNNISGGHKNLTVIGNESLQNDNAGFGHIVIGYQAGNSLNANETNDILVGSSGVAGENNTVRIGNSSHTDTYLAGTIHGNGSALTNLNASQLTGTVPDAQLSNNIARLNLNQTWSGSQNMTNVTQVGGLVIYDNRKITSPSGVGPTFYSTNGNATVTLDIYDGSAVSGFFTSQSKFRLGAGNFRFDLFNTGVMFVPNYLSSSNGVASYATNYGSFTGNFTNTSAVSIYVNLTNATAAAWFDWRANNWLPAAANVQSSILGPNGWITNSSGGGFYHGL